MNALNVLFVCDQSCALSLMAESILTSVGTPRFRAFSAGACGVQPGVLEVLAAYNLPVANLRGKSLDEFRGPDAPRMDFIITLCELAAREIGDWPGEPFIAHWNIRAEGVQSEEAYRDQFWTLMRRIKIFTSLPHGAINKRVLQRRALTLQPSYL